jgi:hypothetical protein
MTSTQTTFDLTPTRGQPDYLLHLVSIADFAIAEHYRTGWLPGGRGDARLMRSQLQGIRTAASLERPLRDLGKWVRSRD